MAYRDDALRTQELAAQYETFRVKFNYDGLASLDKKDETFMKE